MLDERRCHNQIASAGRIADAAGGLVVRRRGGEPAARVESRDVDLRAGIAVHVKSGAPRFALAVLGAALQHGVKVCAARALENM